MRRSWFGALMALGMLLVMSGLALANSAPPTRQGERGGVLVPGRSDQVHILREQLRFEMDEGLFSAEVIARYDMQNRGAALTNYPVIFALQDAGEGTVQKMVVSWNGESLPITAVNVAPASDALEALAAAWTTVEFSVDPVSGKPVDVTGFHGRSSLQFGQFELNLPAGGTGTLEVRYQHTAAQDRRSRAHPVYHYQYLLLPARAWASFGALEISVKAPERIFFSATLPFTYADGEYRASFKGLPEKNLAFGIMSRKGILFHWGNAGPYYMIAFAVGMAVAVALGMGLGRLAGLIKSPAGAQVAGIWGGLFVGGFLDVLVTMGVFALMPAIDLSKGYDAVLIGFGQCLVAIIVTTALTGVETSRQNRRRYGWQRPAPDPWQGSGGLS